MTRDEAITILSRQPPEVRDAAAVFVETSGIDEERATGSESDRATLGEATIEGFVEAVAAELRAIEQAERPCSGSRHVATKPASHCQCGKYTWSDPQQFITLDEGEQIELVGSAVAWRTGVSK